MRDKGPHPSSLIPHPLFAVRTPTATVTDLGTEFGVTVSNEGGTQVHVLQGAVDARTTASPGKAERSERVIEGSAVEIAAAGKEIKRVAYAPRSFTRQLQRVADSPAETAYIKTVLADRPLAYWPLNEPAGARKFLDRSGNGFHGYAMRRVAAGLPGPLAGSRAAGFDGNGSIDIGRQDRFAFTGSFTVEAWLWVAEVIGNPLGYARVISADDGGRFPAVADTGWGLGCLPAPTLPPRNPDNRPPCLDFAFYGGQVFFNDVTVRTQTWRHVAAIYDAGKSARLFVNGEHLRSVADPKPIRHEPTWVCIGDAACGQVPWHGRIAHVAVYPHTLGEEQIRRHCQVVAGLQEPEK